ncbi:hypothetical protein LINGRAHAP2_LOCUS24051 [Linum grandiflorum]
MENPIRTRLTPRPNPTGPLLPYNVIS